MAAQNTNTITVSGNLVRDPEVFTTSGGKTKTTIRLAVNNGGPSESPYPVTYVDVIAWNGRGENAAKYLVKGRFVIVSGRLDYREWEKDGTRFSKHEIVADNIEFGPGGRRDESDESPELAAVAAGVGEDDIPF